MLNETGFDYFGGVITTSGPDSFKTKGLRSLLAPFLPVGSARPHTPEDEFQVTAAPWLIAIGKAMAMLPIPDIPAMTRAIGERTRQSFNPDKPIVLFSSDVMVDVMGPRGWRALLKPKVRDAGEILEHWADLLKYRDVLDTTPFRARVGFVAAVPGKKSKDTVGIFKQKETFFNVRPIDPRVLEEYARLTPIEVLNRTNGGFDWLRPPFSSGIVTIDNMPVSRSARGVLRHQLRAVPQHIHEMFGTLGGFHHSVAVEGRGCLGAKAKSEISGFLKDYPFLGKDGDLNPGTWLRMYN